MIRVHNGPVLSNEYYVSVIEAVYQLIGNGNNDDDDDMTIRNVISKDIIPLLKITMGHDYIRKRAYNKLLLKFNQ